MKATRLFLFSCVFSLMLAACNMPGVDGSGDETGITIKPISMVPGTEDGIYEVQYFTDSGILQGHSRSETEYQDLAAGSATLSSGSYLRTLEGEAFVVLPGDSILKLGINTEIQIGLYENGIMIWQYSGETMHFVVFREGASYVVATPFGTVESLGTEYEVRVDYPASGWVTVYWGEIGVIQTDPTQVYGLVPEGAIFISPGGALEYYQLQPGDTITWDIDPDTGQPRRRDDPVLPDLTAQRNRERSQRIRELMQDYWDGTITREEYQEELNIILTEALHLTRPIEAVHEEEHAEVITPIIPIGRLYAGMVGNNVVSVCFDGRSITRVTWGVELECTDLTTSDEYIRQDVFDILYPPGVVNSDGSFSFTYEVDPAISINTAINASGSISSGGGRITLTLQSQSDVEFCGSGIVTIPITSTGADCLE